MENANPTSTPYVVGLKLSKHGEGKLVNPTMFRSLVGNLMYLIATRPDITYAVSLVSQFMEKPFSNHWETTKRILRYVKGTLDYGIFYQASVLVNLIGYTDSDLAGRCHLLWLRGILENLKHDKEGPTTLFCDNSSTISISKDPVLHGKTKHIRIRYHFLRELMNENIVHVEYYRTNEQKVDIFTKPLAVHCTVPAASAHCLIAASHGGLLAAGRGDLLAAPVEFCLWLTALSACSRLAVRVACGLFLACRRGYSHLCRLPQECIS
ncbi:hypothetical protein ZIOFF_010317 [Zingiber officinale]|uniref:Uncharacterized protein n=1 Tax=Zingiber officinale TaxID=94328 RepID=A0A8J5LY73_ZINOF|nr:hypothetical protein ZIOFF_010317 [Zingiber officinale]